MKYIGIDLHSNCFTACILNETGESTTHSYNLCKDNMLDFFARLDDQTHVLVEASTNTFAFVKLIKPFVGSIQVANPYKLKLISMTGKKTDRVDAQKLARFLKMQITSGETLIDPVYIPDDDIQELRSYFSTYQQLRKLTVSVKNRIHSLFKQDLKPYTKQYIFGKKTRREIMAQTMASALRFQIDLLFDQLDSTQENIKKLEEQIMVAGAKYFDQIDILTSMKGISVFTALAIISDIATVDRFANSKKFAAYLRSVPTVDSSNETTRIGSTTKQGRKLSVRLLTQSLNHFRDSNEKLNRWYQSKLQHKARGKIRMALCRKVFTEIYQMLKKGEYHYWRDEVNHRKKVDAYLKLLQKHKIEVAA